MKSGRSVPVGVALADSLLVCVLQEPLSDADVPHLKSLLSRLEVREVRTPGRDETACVRLAHSLASSDGVYVQSLCACRSACVSLC